MSLFKKHLFILSCPFISTEQGFRKTNRQTLSSGGFRVSLVALYGAGCLAKGDVCMQAPLWVGVIGCPLALPSLEWVNPYPGKGVSYAWKFRKGPMQAALSCDTGARGWGPCASVRGGRRWGQSLGMSSKVTMRPSNSCLRPGAAFGNSSLFTGLVGALSFPIRHWVPFCARSCRHQARSPSLHSSLTQLPDPALLASAEHRVPGSTHCSCPNHCLQCVVRGQAEPPLSQGLGVCLSRLPPGQGVGVEVVGEPEHPRYLGIFILHSGRGRWGRGDKGGKTVVCIPKCQRKYHCGKNVPVWVQVLILSFGCMTWTICSLCCTSYFFIHKRGLMTQTSQHGDTMNIKQQGT